jgi:hypothetical protein
VGEIVAEIAGIVTVADLDLLVSACAVALTVTVAGVVRLEGAV